MVDFDAHFDLADIDLDGIPDEFDQFIDLDGDGLSDLNQLDLDLDGDGMADWLAPQFVDLDAYGIGDGFEPMGPDIDGDSVPDDIDQFLDTNKNGISDAAFYKYLTRLRINYPFSS